MTLDRRTQNPHRMVAHLHQEGIRDDTQLLPSLSKQVLNFSDASVAARQICCRQRNEKGQRQRYSALSISFEASRVTPPIDL
jgi:hypothetical protein